MRYAYPANVGRESDGVTVTFDDLPGATWGTTDTEALARAEAFLVTVLGALVEDGKPVPVPREAKGRPVVPVPSLVAAKLALHDAMLDAGLSNVEVARRLGLEEKAVRRLRDPLHRSHIENVEAALRPFGRRLEVTAVAA